MTKTQLALTRTGVFYTAIGMTDSKNRDSDRSGVIAAIKVYGLAGSDASHVGDWCMAQFGYGGGL